MASDPLAQPGDSIRRLYAYVAYRIGRGPDAEDIVSDTIERALRYRDSYDPAAGTPIGWMIGITNRRLAEARPDTSRHSDIDVEELLGSQEDFAAAVAERADLHAAIARLTDRDRELLALRYGADLSAREVGQLLEMRTNSVEVALHRALGRLRRSLESD